MDRYGNRFGFLVFDEVHHLPGESYSHGAELSIAPYRLGLTATLERPDGRHLMLRDLVGPTPFMKRVSATCLAIISPSTIQSASKSIWWPKSGVEYETARSQFNAFLESKNLRLGSASGWQNFVRLSARSSDGRRAMLAYRRYRKVALGTTAKLRVLEDLLKKHPRDRMLIFTNDNETVYNISEQFLIPAITHQTRTKERREILKAFNEGDILALVTSRVLNEGVNVPEANVAVVCFRERVRSANTSSDWGAFCAAAKANTPILYEVISRNTVEDRIFPPAAGNTMRTMGSNERCFERRRCAYRRSLYPGPTRACRPFAQPRPGRAPSRFY